MNELVALHNRHLVRKAEPLERTIRAVADHWVTRFPRFYNYRTFSEEEVIANTPQNRKKRVIGAFERYHEEGYLPKDSVVRAFIKHEKSPDSPGDDPMDKDPRLIQYRSYKHTSLFKCVLMPFEHKLWKLGQDFQKRAPNYLRVFSKGMNSFTIAANLRHGWDSISEPVADLWDVSRMDAHLGRYLRELIEFQTYRKGSGSDQFEPFLRAMRRNRGWTRGGIHYTSEYTMCSGEACTSSGDSIIMAAVLKYIYRHTPHHILVCGDDSVVIRTREFVPDRTIFEQCGLPVKGDTAYLFEHVEFCQTRPVCVSGTWRMVRNPERVLSRTQFTLKQFPTKQLYYDWMASVGRGELACCDGVPVLQEFAKGLMLLGNWRQTFYDEHLAMRPELYKGEREVTLDTRLSFLLAWGMSLEEQKYLEERMREGIPKAL